MGINHCFLYEYLVDLELLIDNSVFPDWAVVSLYHPRKAARVGLFPGPLFCPFPSVHSHTNAAMLSESMSVRQGHSKSSKSSTLFAILSPLHFQIHYRITVSISTKIHAWILVATALDPPFREELTYLQY